jgi:hypothetical protein
MKTFLIPSALCLILKTDTHEQEYTNIAMKIPLPYSYHLTPTTYYLVSDSGFR